MNSDHTMKLYGKVESLRANKKQWEERMMFLSRLDSFVETVCGDMNERNMLKRIIDDEV